MDFKQMKLRTRLGMIFFIIVLMIASVVAIGIINIQSIHTQLEKIVKQSNVKLNGAWEMVEQIYLASGSVKTMILLTDDMQIKIEKKNFDDARAGISKRQEVLEKLPLDATEKKILNDIKSVREGVKKANDRMIELALAHKDKEAIEYLANEANTVYERRMELVKYYLDYVKKTTDKETESVHDQTVSARNIIVIVSAVAIFLSLVLAYGSVKWILSQIGGSRPIFRRSFRRSPGATSRWFSGRKKAAPRDSWPASTSSWRASAVS